MSYPRTYEEAIASVDKRLMPADWNAMKNRIDGFTPSGTFKSPYSYLIDFDGTDYHACNAFQTVYGGPDDEGGVDGTNIAAVSQAAIDATYTAGGGRVMFKAMDATFTSYLLLKPNVELLGEGMGCTILRFDGLPYGLKSAGTAGTPHAGLGIFNLQVAGDNNAVSAGVSLDYTYTAVRISGVGISYFATGLKLDSCYAIGVDNCEINYNTYAGVDAYDSHGTSYIRTKTYGNLNGFILNNCCASSISHCDMEVNTGTGVIITTHGIYNSVNAAVMYCYVENNGKEVADSGISTQIVGNYFRGSAIEGSETPYAVSTEGQGCQIRGNHFQLYDTADIWIVDTATDPVITGNYHYNGTAFLQDDSPAGNAIVHDNPGYRTEAFGRFTIAGGSYATVTHNMDVQPNCLYLTFDDDASIVSYSWLNINETQTRIYTAAAGTFTGSWHAKYVKP